MACFNVSVEKCVGDVTPAIVVHRQRHSTVSENSPCLEKVKIRGHADLGWDPHEAESLSAVDQVRPCGCTALRPLSQEAKVKTLKRISRLPVVRSRCGRLWRRIWCGLVRLKPHIDGERRGTMIKEAPHQDFAVALAAGSRCVVLPHEL